MPLHYENLDARTRELMMEEVDSDVKAGVLTLSGRLSAGGRAAYEELLRQAVREHDDDWLANQLRRFMSASETYQRGGKVLTRKMPVNAADVLAEGEFNRFYVRSLCLRAAAENRRLQICRGRPSAKPRPTSEDIVGREYDGEGFLRDLRDTQGRDTYLKVPGGPNSGITLRLL